MKRRPIGCAGNAFVLALVTGLIFTGLHSPAEAAPTVTLTQPVHFAASDGSDVVAEAGTYQVDAADSRLTLSMEGRALLLLEAKPTTHSENIDSPLTVTVPGDDPDLLHVVLLLPNGQALDAPGSISGTRPRDIAMMLATPLQIQFAVTQQATKVMVPGVTGPTTGTLALPAPPARPGELAIRTQKGFYLTAINGGGRTADPIVVTASTTAGPWEKFRFTVTSPSSPHDKSIQTASGNYLTAVNGGGLTANVLHTDATQAKDWERFRLLDLGVGNFAPSYYAIQTIKGFYVTTVGAGGKNTDAIHTDAKQIQAWEQFGIVQCGDVGSGYQYGVMAADGSFLAAQFAGGRSQGDIGLDPRARAETRFKLIRQGDGSYALQTSNGVNFVTALGGGGQVQKYLKCDPGLFGACLDGYSTIFHTDARQVQAWEKFRVIDQGNCTYAIQTASGFYVGIYKDSSGGTLLTTRRDGASTANEKFQLVVYGLASPVVLQ
jgi:hypothetical protein